MIYKIVDDWCNVFNKYILLFGMFGLGKIVIFNLLCGQGDWFYYFIDY